eukprot:SAG31_NODE_31086_length_372_cov_0.941392_1_plen_62_part_10
MSSARKAGRTREGPHKKYSSVDGTQRTDHGEHRPLKRSDMSHLPSVASPDRGRGNGAYSQLI